ncbi:gluconate 2-dehydrogenase subunit 3 family protein [Zhouia spongiae]|uniref:Gluconate 2-dehydrogenase subunit 3 family protein n=1 Tax=Zhouia spongiae TaxID=2202721 RepID=A0ABY3YPK6_9FLAO|nr:gluconate 2-dehydrogenase subunit 3 family protein [Zhouia spongiae]UNY99474.1 gluconate 2-dehydrogenase subunit 3 family protein [Zhouia spongiae]
MDRRKALRNIGLTTGFVVATPSLLSLLQSCNTAVENWQPEYLTVDEGVVLIGLVDTILPKTDLPSASEVNVPQFIDVILKDVVSSEEQEQKKNAMKALITEIRADYSEDLNKVKEQDYQKILDKYLSKAEREGEEKEIAQLLGSIKWMTINAYRNSEVIGETVLAYDPVPGQYLGCENLQDLTGGKSWSL